MAKRKNKSTLMGALAVILAASLWGCIGMFSRRLTAVGFTSIQTVAVRAIMTVAVIFVIILIKGPSLLKIRFRDIWLFLGTGILSFLFFNVCYMNSLNENSLSVACFLLYTSPFWVTFLSRLVFGERITTVKIIALLICFGSIVLLCLSDSLVLTKRGLVFGLLSGLGYALYSIFGKVAVRRYHSLTITFYTFLFATLGALPMCNATKLVSLLTIPENVFLSIGIAVVITILPYLFYTYGLSQLEAGKAAVFAITEPAVAALVGHFFFGEYITLVGTIGIIGIFLGMILLENAKKR